MPQAYSVMIDPESSQWLRPAVGIRAIRFMCRLGADHNCAKIHGAHGMFLPRVPFLSHIFGGSPKQPAIYRRPEFPSANGGETPELVQTASRCPPDKKPLHKKKRTFAEGFGILG